MLALEHSQAVCVCASVQAVLSSEGTYTHTFVLRELHAKPIIDSSRMWNIQLQCVFFFVVVSLCLIVNVQIWITDCCVLRPAPKIRSVATNRTTNLNQPVADRWLHV